MYYSFYVLLWFFAIYAFLGWCAEVIYATVTTGKFINRGFLSGPICPIYGLGMIAVVLCLMPIKDNIFILFLGSVLLTTALELITGLALEKIFNEKWWDYSDIPFNFKGYICLKFSLRWGVGCVFVMDILHPLIYTLIKAIPLIIGIILLIIIYIDLFLDISATVIALFKIKRFIHLAGKMESRIKHASDTIGENVSDGVAVVIKVKDKGKQELEELIAKYESFTKDKLRAIERLKHAFPKLKLKSRKDILDHLKQLRK